MAPAGQKGAWGGRERERNREGKGRHQGRKGRVLRPGKECYQCQQVFHPLPGLDLPARPTWTDASEIAAVGQRKVNIPSLIMKAFEAQTSPAECSSCQLRMAASGLRELSWTGLPMAAPHCWGKVHIQTRKATSKTLLGLAEKNKNSPDLSPNLLDFSLWV